MQALNVPPEHWVCWVDPDGQNVPSPQKAFNVGKLQKLPSEHTGQTELAPVPLEYVPEPQTVQAPLLVKPVPVWYAPAEQAVQARLVCIPVPVWNVPA